MSALRAELVRRRGFPIEAELACEPGELLAIAGPSGGGKTTMLRMIAGLERIDAGAVRCGDETWADAERGVHRPPERRGVGLVFQHYALFPHLDAAANLVVALGHLPRGRRRARARELLGIVNLEGLEDRRPAALSGGQRQRVALARALARTEAPGAGVLLLDEPFAAVDAATRERLHGELARLRARLERPVLLVTHDSREVLRLADAVAVVHRGRTLDAGPVERVTGRPASARAARLLGHRNLVDARVAGARDGLAELVLGARPPGDGPRDGSHERPHDGRDDGPRVRVPLALVPEALRAPGTRLVLLVPGSAIVLHRRNRASRGERENPLAGRVDELVRLGDEVELAVRLDGGADAPRLHFRLSRHVASRNALAPGVPVGLSLVADELHPLPTLPSAS